MQAIALSLQTFKEIDEMQTSMDGPGVRDFDAWRLIHTKYWNSMLESLGKEVEGDTRGIVEEFSCSHPVAWIQPVSVISIRSPDGPKKLKARAPLYGACCIGRGADSTFAASY